METRNVEVTYDKDKLEALDVFLRTNNSYIEIEIIKQLDGLYSKTVPATVRKFIKSKAELSDKREED